MPGHPRGYRRVLTGRRRTARRVTRAWRARVESWQLGGSSRRNAREITRVEVGRRGLYQPSIPPETAGRVSALDLKPCDGAVRIPGGRKRFPPWRWRRPISRERFPKANNAHRLPCSEWWITLAGLRVSKAMFQAASTCSARMRPTRQPRHGTPAATPKTKSPEHGSGLLRSRLRCSGAPECPSNDRDQTSSCHRQGTPDEQRAPHAKFASANFQLTMELRKVSTNFGRRLR